jgi:hypothetical protein
MKMLRPSKFNDATGNSNWQGDARIVELLHLYNPIDALDLGVGKWGKFGYLFRKSFHEWRNIVYNENESRYLIGIEGSKENAEVLKDSCWYYNEIIVADILEYTRILYKSEKKFDVVFLGDVLEHLVWHPAIELIQLLRVISRKAIIVQLPIGDYPQEVPQNPLETHETTWTYEKLNYLKPAGLQVFKDFLGRDFVVFAIPK